MHFTAHLMNIFVVPVNVVKFRFQLHRSAKANFIHTQNRDRCLDKAECIFPFIERSLFEEQGNIKFQIPVNVNIRKLTKIGRTKYTNLRKHNSKNIRFTACHGDNMNIINRILSLHLNLLYEIITYKSCPLDLNSS